MEASEIRVGTAGVVVIRAAQRDPAIGVARSGTEETRSGYIIGVTNTVSARQILFACPVRD